MSEHYENLSGASGRARFFRPERHAARKLFAGAPPSVWFDDREFLLDNISATGTGLSNTDIYTLYPDKSLLLIGTYNGLDILSLTPFTKYNRRHGNIPNDIMAFTEDGHQNVWVGTYEI